MTNSGRNRIAILLASYIISALVPGCGDVKRDLYGFTSDDYAIYKLAIEYAEPNVSDFVVVGSKKNRINWRRYHSHALSQVPSEYAEPLEAFLAVDSVAVDWSGLSTLGFEMMDEDSVTTIVKRRIRQRLPYWRDRIGLSHVGYDKKRQRALIFCTWTCGNQCGQGCFTYLSRSGGTWKIVDSHMVFIS